MMHRMTKVRRQSRLSSVLFMLAALGLASCTQTASGGSSSSGGDPADASVSASSSSSSSSSGVVDAGPVPLPTVPVQGLTIQPRDGSSFLINAVASAQTTVDFATYILTDDPTERALTAAAARGVVVRVLLDPDQAANASARTYLSARSVTVRNAPAGFTNFHEKALMVDGTRGLVMTLNASYSAFATNREYGVGVTRAAEVADLMALFNADWNAAPNPQVLSNLVVSPNNARSRIMALIATAQTEIAVAMEVLSDDGIIATLKAKMDTGVAVRVELAHPNDVTQNAAQATTLRNRGFTVKFLQSPTLHAKLIIVDGTYAYVGSVNLTRASLDQNREVGVLVEDPAIVAALKTQADADWAAGVMQ